jgi:hypothetical protein
LREEKKHFSNKEGGKKTMSLDAAAFVGDGLTIAIGGAYIQRRTLTNEFQVEPLPGGHVSIDNIRYLSGKTVIFNGCSFMPSVQPAGRVRVITTKGDRFLLPLDGKFTLLASGNLRDEQTGLVCKFTECFGQRTECCCGRQRAERCTRTHV